MATKIHGGSGVPQGRLNRGTARQPSPTHGGTNLRKGETKTVSTPASRQPRLATSWHGTVRK
ncbi:hypothetical protein [Bradyrhizobium sp.]|jgi:hypothetical protein|uniref:hypothetical protein n=1 Tax=Bradyrhizobium sp. TaxID=376 RepID=UPI003BB098F0